MGEIKLEQDNLNHEAFNLYQDGHKQATMVLKKADGKMTILHTEVARDNRGEGLADQLLDNMVAYAREHELKVIPLCPFVHAQFKRHPDSYSDIWEK